jgi:hypothetical protein
MLLTPPYADLSGERAPGLPGAPSANEPPGDNTPADGRPALLPSPLLLVRRAALRAATRSLAAAILSGDPRPVAAGRKEHDGKQQGVKLGRAMLCLAEPLAPERSHGAAHPGPGRQLRTATHPPGWTLPAAAAVRCAPSLWAAACLRSSWLCSAPVRRH